MDKTDFTKSNYEVVNFYNVGDTEFRGMWGGEEYVIAPKERKQMVKFMAEHFAGQLATKILMKDGKDWGNDSPARQELIAKILGIVVEIPIPTPVIYASTAEVKIESQTEPEFIDIPVETPKEEIIQEPPLQETQEIPKAKVYTCGVCSKSFSHPLALAGHKRSHKT
jgi:hypothetical protein